MKMNPKCAGINLTLRVIDDCKNVVSLFMSDSENTKDIWNCTARPLYSKGTKFYSPKLPVQEAGLSKLIISRENIEKG